MKLLVLTVLIASLAIGVDARLMGTKDEMIQRYGQPVKIIKDGEHESMLTFKKGELTVTVKLGQAGDMQGQTSLEGRIIREEVSIENSRFTDQAITDILKESGFSPDPKTYPKESNLITITAKNDTLFAEISRTKITLYLQGFTVPEKEVSGY